MPATPIARLTRRYTFDGRVVEPLALVAIAAMAGFATIMLVGVLSGLMSYRQELNGIAAAFGVLWLCGVGCQTIRLRRAGEALKVLSIAGLLSMTASLASAVLARTAAPLADDLLVRLDQALFAGFDWSAAIPALDGHRLLAVVLSRAYASLDWQPTVLTVFLCVTGNARQAWRALAAMAIALAICVAVFPFFPAVGGYVHFGIPHDAVPGVIVPSAWKGPGVLAALRDGRLDYLGVGTMQGIVTMPSFHAASAVILLWGFSHSRLLRWPFTALNLVMLVSTVPIGGHYLVDVVAGALIAVLAICAVHRGSRLARRGPASRKVAPPDSQTIG